MEAEEEKGNMKISRRIEPEECVPPTFVVPLFLPAAKPLVLRTVGVVVVLVVVVATSLSCQTLDKSLGSFSHPDFSSGWDPSPTSFSFICLLSFFLHKCILLVYRRNFKKIKSLVNAAGL